ncbi:MAG: aldo/keto reductase [Planctomycetota bacterium]
MPSALPAYQPAEDRYTARPDAWFRRCGHTGLTLPAISLGCWHNFGDPGTDSLKSTSENAIHDNCRAMLRTAFDLGITHFDLANNYGPPPGSAETRVGRILKDDFRANRDELIVSSKAGYRMWPGPYGEWNSRKSLIASCDQSLQRLQLDYVDIFYSHRPDPLPGGTPLEETMGALDALVQQGKALYVGISNYPPGQTAEALRVCAQHGFAKPIIHQPSYSMLNRWIEQGLTSVLHAQGLGSMVFSPLAGGRLTGKYLNDIPADSRAANEHSPFLQADGIDDATRAKLHALNNLAEARGQSLSQLALAWVLRPQPNGYAVTSALIGASRPAQIQQCAAALDAPPLSDDELTQIESALAG